MKLTDLLEKTSINQKLVYILATQIIEAIPKYRQLEWGDSVTLDHVVFDIKEIGNTFGELGKTLATYITRYVPVHIENRYNGSMSGGYTHALNGGSHMDAIYIQIPKITGVDGKDYDLDNLIGDRRVVGVLMHEIRHVAQRQEFGRFFQRQTIMMQQADRRGKGREEYRKDPLEIDAALVHIIHEFEPMIGYEPDRFVQKVMDELQSYKDLTPKQIDHYTRKVSVYLSDLLGNDPTIADTTPSDRLKTKKADALQQRINEAVWVIEDSVDDLSHLRSIGMGDNYNTSFNSKPFSSVMISAMKDQSPIDPKYVAQSVMYLSLVNEWAKQHDEPFDTSLYLDLIKSDDYIDETIELISTHKFFDHYDRPLMIQWVRNLDPSTGGPV